LVALPTVVTPVTLQLLIVVQLVTALVPTLNFPDSHGVHWVPEVPLFAVKYWPASHRAVPHSASTVLVPAFRTPWTLFPSPPVAAASHVRWALQVGVANTQSPEVASFAATVSLTTRLVVVMLATVNVFLL
jgi:hypothetical protein